MSYSQSVTRTLDDSDEWVPYFGPEGGEGMQNTRTGEVDYDRDPRGFDGPGETQQVGLPGMDYDEDQDRSSDSDGFMERHMVGLTDKREVTEVEGDTFYTGIESDGDMVIVTQRADGEVEVIGSPNDFLRRHDAERVYEAEFGNYAEEFNREFWENPPETLYHNTVVDAVFPEEGGRSGVILGGLQTSNKTRGLRNTGVGSAVFTSARALDVYGDVKIEVDVQAMDEDGYTPEVTKEPPWARLEKQRRLDYELFAFPHDVYVDVGSTYEDTRIFYDDIPTEYLTFTPTDDESRKEIQQRYDEWSTSEAAQEMPLDERRQIEQVLERDLGIKVGDAKTAMQLAEWVPYRGPRGGQGWENVVTGERRYQKDKPGDSGDSGARGEADGAWAFVEDVRGRKYSEFPVDPDDSDWGVWSDYYLILPDGTRETLTSAYSDTIMTRDEDGKTVRHDPDGLVQIGALIEEPAQVFSDELKADERVAAAVHLGRYGTERDMDGGIESGQRKWAKVFDDMSDRELAEALWLSTRNIGYLEQETPYMTSDFREWVGAYVEDDGTLEGDYTTGMWAAMNPANLAHITSRMSKEALLSTVDKIAEELEGKGDGPKELRWRVVTAAYVYTSEEGVRESLREKYPDTLAGMRDDVDVLLYSDDVDEFKSGFIEGWHGMAGTSAAYLMQQAARDLEPNKTGKSEAWARNVPVADVYLPEQMKQNVRKLYEETQSKLPDEPKTLYRGTKSKVTVHGNLESWTELKSIAKEFGDNVMTAEVDPKDVFATWETLGDEWPEEKVKGKKEWMVLGGGLA